MPVIVMIGPHACGKTAALRRWAARYTRVVPYSLDDLRRDYPDNDAKGRLVESRRGDSSVSVIESARGFSGVLDALTPNDPPVLAVTCPEAVGRAWLVDRRKDKPLSSYWTQRRLEYECIDYVINALRKRNLPFLHVEFGLDRAAGWEKMDAHFGRLYRDLINVQNRRRLVCP